MKGIRAIKFDDIVLIKVEVELKLYCRSELAFSSGGRDEAKRLWL
jgi:hypothetical protein